MACIIDCHCHFGIGDGLNGPWDTRADIRKYLMQAAEAGVEQINLFAAFHSDYAQANAEVARVVRSCPKRFYGFAFVHAERDANRIFELVQVAVQHYGFVGIKAHRHDARLTREVCEVARAFHLPILYDIMGEVSIVELLATEYPDVPFIIPHLGSFADDWKAQMAFLPLLERHPNVFTDTSGVRRFELLERAVRRAGAHKILFGSDGPWLHPGVELAKVYALKISEHDRLMILRDNFRRLISKVRRWPVRGTSSYGAGMKNLFVNTADPWVHRP